MVVEYYRLMALPMSEGRPARVGGPENTIAGIGNISILIGRRKTTNDVDALLEHGGAEISSRVPHRHGGLRPCNAIGTRVAPAPSAIENITIDDIGESVEEQCPLRIIKYPGNGIYQFRPIALDDVSALLVLVEVSILDVGINDTYRAIAARETVAPRGMRTFGTSASLVRYSSANQVEI